MRIYCVIKVAYQISGKGFINNKIATCFGKKYKYFFYIT